MWRWRRRDRRELCGSEVRKARGGRRQHRRNAPIMARLRTDFMAVAPAPDCRNSPAEGRRDRILRAGGGRGQHAAAAATAAHKRRCPFAPGAHRPVDRNLNERVLVVGPVPSLQTLSLLGGEPMQFRNIRFMGDNARLRKRLRRRYRLNGDIVVVNGIEPADGAEQQTRARQWRPTARSGYRPRPAPAHSECARQRTSAGSRKGKSVETPLMNSPNKASPMPMTATSAATSARHPAGAAIR